MRLLAPLRSSSPDGELIERARAGDDDAFAELYRRHHAVATRTSRWLLHSRHDADDAVADAFASVLQALRNGNGPREDFRAYLLACVRNACSLRRARAINSTSLSDDDDAGGVALEDPERYVEADTVARAFATLSPRWQQTLWLVDVEQRSVDEVGSQLGLRANAVAALTYRAREGFASAYLSEHVGSASSPMCATVGAKLGAYVRGNAGASDEAMIERHLDECAECRKARDDITDMNASLRSLEGPATGAAVAASTMAITLPLAGGIAAIAGSSLAVKFAAAVLVLVPTVAIGAHRIDRGMSSDRVIAATVAPLQPVPLSAGRGVTLAPPDVAGGADAVAPTGGNPAATTAAGEQPTAPPSSGAMLIDAAVSAAAAAGGSAPVSGALPGAIPAVSLPPVSTPAIGLPPITTPAVGLPPISTPAVSLPPITTPAITVPPISVVVTVPPVSLPLPVPTVSVPPVTVTVPAITVPSVTVPAVTVPSVTVPAVTVPSVTVPAVTVPTVTVPAVTIPPVTVPPITVPGLG